MLMGFLIMAAGGLLCMLAGILLAFKHKMSLLHDYHTEHVRQKHTRVYCLMVGIGMLLIGAGITIVIVIVVPNGISSLLHVIVLLAALMLMMLIQYLKFRKADRAAKQEAEASEAKEPDAEDETEQRAGDEGQE